MRGAFHRLQKQKASVSSARGQCFGGGCCHEKKPAGGVKHETKRLGLHATALRPSTPDTRRKSRCAPLVRPVFVCLLTVRTQLVAAFFE